MRIILNFKNVPSPSPGQSAELSPGSSPAPAATMTSSQGTSSSVWSGGKNDKYLSRLTKIIVIIFPCSSRDCYLLLLQGQTGPSLSSVPVFSSAQFCLLTPSFLPPPLPSQVRIGDLANFRQKSF